ncbi:MAG: hypothetical protein ACI4V7_08810 [Succinivibrionaceae bacterium]
MKNIFVSVTFFILFNLFSNTANATIEGWHNVATKTEVLSNDLNILEAVFIKQDFVNKLIMRIGCKFSHPEPAIILQLPSLSTDIINPKTPAYIEFSFKKHTKKSDRIKLAGIVNHGDVVLLPNMSGKQSLSMDDLFSKMKNENNKRIYATFYQNRRIYSFNIPLSGFADSFDIAKKSCEG